jgi:hypothetical protein
VFRLQAFPAQGGHLGFRGAQQHWQMRLHEKQQLIQLGYGKLQHGDALPV